MKGIQHFTEQFSAFLLSEMLYSFDHLLRLARPCSVLLSAALPCLMAIKNVKRQNKCFANVERCLVKCCIRLTGALFTWNELNYSLRAKDIPKVPKHFKASFGTNSIAFRVSTLC